MALFLDTRERLTSTQCGLFLGWNDCRNAQNGDAPKDKNHHSDLLASKTTVLPIDAAEVKGALKQLIRYSLSNSPAPPTSITTTVTTNLGATMSRTSHQVSQNVDNFLREKSSTRLHQPPGGGSSVGSLIFGGGCDQSPFAGRERRGSLPRKEETPEQTNPYAKDFRRRSTDYQPSQQSMAPYGQQQSQMQLQTRQTSSNQYASGSNQNAGNVLTDRRITRIHAPPGGASSITFG